MTATASSSSRSRTRPDSVAALERLSPETLDELYRPFLHHHQHRHVAANESNGTTTTTGAGSEGEEGVVDWVDELELDAVQQMASSSRDKVKILILYGSLRTRSFSRLTAYEAARVLTKLGCDVRVYDPTGLPLKDDVSDRDAKVTELRALSEWSDGHLWSCPEQHGAITGVFKTQIDWIPLSVGSVRPTQGRTLAVVQVNGGSQSFNVVNTLRLLGRWMRMFTIPNQSSIPKAWTCFDKNDRLLPSSNRDRLVDVCEELVKTTLVLRPHFEQFGDRFSEREERRRHGRLRTQQEVEDDAKKKKKKEEPAAQQANGGAGEGAQKPTTTTTTAHILKNM
ncbi:hypothetical protein JCM3766R1_004422 [Sporobolomyces carnicolor]